MLSGHYSLSVKHIDGCIRQTQDLHGGEYEDLIGIIVEMIENEIGLGELYMTLPKDVLMETALRIPPNTINSLCKTNKKMAAICSDPHFKLSYHDSWYASGIYKLWHTEWLTPLMDGIHYYGSNLFYSNNVRALFTGSISLGQVDLYFSRFCDNLFDTKKSELLITIRFGNKPNDYFNPQYTGAAFINITDGSGSNSYDYGNIGRPPSINREQMKSLFKYNLNFLFRKPKSAIRDEFMKFFSDFKQRSRFMKPMKPKCK